MQRLPYPLRLCLLLFVAIAGSVAANSENRLFIEPFTLNEGETVNLPIYMDNTDEWGGMNFDLSMPEFLEIAGKPTLNEERMDIDEFKVSYSAKNSRVILYNMAGLAIQGNSGIVMWVPIHVKEGASATAGEYQVTLCAAVLSVVDGTSTLKPDDCTTTMTYVAQPPVAPEVKISTPTQEVVANPSETFEVPVYMDNNFDISGVQFDVYLPQGFTLTKVIRGDRISADADVVKGKPNPDNAVRVLISDIVTNLAVSGNSGLLVTLRVTAGDPFTEASVPLKVNNVIVASSTQERITDPEGFTVDIKNCYPLYEQALSEIAALRSALADVEVEIAEKAPDVKDQFPTADISARIDALQTAVEGAYADHSILTGYDSLMAPASEISQAVAKLLADALAAQAAHDDQIRQAANQAAYNAALAQIAELQDSLDQMKAHIAEAYPEIDVATEVAAAQQLIDKARADALAAFETVATEGTFSFAVPKEAINAAIAAIETAAVNLQAEADETARQAANQAAYDAALAQIAELQEQLNATVDELKEKYPDADIADKVEAIQAMIDQIRVQANEAFAAVAEEGTFEFTFNPQPVLDAIDSLVATTGITEVYGDELEMDVVAIYSLDGRQIVSPQVGQINIIVRKNGQIEKIYLR